jgi:hypothetical protein
LRLITLAVEAALALSPAPADPDTVVHAPTAAALKITNKNKRIALIIAFSNLPEIEENLILMKQLYYRFTRLARS